MNKTHIFPAQIEQLSAMLEWICQQLKEMDFDRGSVQKIELAAEEAIVNVIRHAYRNQTGTIQIQVLSFPKSHAEISIIDQGPPFDPLRQASPVDVNSPLEERALGGLGLFIIRSSMDEIRYQRSGDTNILTLIKRVKPI